MAVDRETADRIAEDREHARQRGRAKPRPLGPLMEQVAAAEHLPRPESIPEYGSRADMLRARARLARSVPRPASPPPRVPEKYEKVRFASTEDRSAVDSGWSPAVAASHEFVRRIVAGSPAIMVALLGHHGTGKSHLAACVAWELYEAHGIRVSYYLWEELVQGLRWGEGRGEHEKPARLVREDLWAERVVIIDEVEATSGTDFDGIELRQFSKNRYARERSVLITGNWDNLASMIGAAAADRYIRAKLVGPSYREGRR